MGKDSNHQKKTKAAKKTNRSRFIRAIIISFIVLYIFNNLKNWQVPILTNNWIACLGVLNILILATVIANIIWLVYRPDWIRSLLKIGLNLINFVVIYVVYELFPFNFSGYGGNSSVLAVKALIVIGLIGLVIGTIVELFRLIFALDYLLSSK